MCIQRHGTNLGNINKNRARTAGAKVARFLFMLPKFWVLEGHFAIIYLDSGVKMYFLTPESHHKYP